MNKPDPEYMEEEGIWTKSTFSGTDTDCVEILVTSSPSPMRWVRDSKNPDGPAILVNMKSLVQAAKGGRLNR